MNFFGLFQRNDINAGIKKAQDNPDSVIIDVRTQQEYAGKHIPGSINIPVGEMENLQRIIPDKNTPIYLYCQSGNRARRVKQFLTAKGYTDVTNIGGIGSYKGKMEKGMVE